MARLGRSLAKLRIANPHGRDEWLERCRKLIAALAERSGATDQLVYIQVTRGVALRDHVMPAGIDADRLHDGQRDEAGHAPSSATTAWPASRARDFRWERGDIKSISLLGNVLARQMSADHGAIETDHVPRRLPDRGVGAATSGSCTKARCSGRRRASTCSKASATS